MCVCVCACMEPTRDSDGYKYEYVQRCGAHKMISDVFLNCSLPDILRQSLSLNLELADLTRLTGQ